MSHYEQGAGEGLLVTRILLYLPRYKKSFHQEVSLYTTEAAVLPTN